MTFTTRPCKTLMACAVLASSSLWLAPAQAHDMNDVLAGGVGAITGAVIGQAVGGKNGTVIGAAIGGAVGVTVAQSNRRTHYPPQPVAMGYPQPVQYVYYPPKHRGRADRDCPPYGGGYYKEPRYHHHRHGWDD